MTELTLNRLAVFFLGFTVGIILNLIPVLVFFFLLDRFLTLEKYAPTAS